MTKRKSEQPTQPAGPVDDADTEGHAFTWKAEDDGKGGRRMRQSWSPDEPAPTQPTRTGAPTPRKSDSRR